MTEIERIISKGILTKDFLKEETRCDFFVDEKRKKLWAVELDLLIEFDRVCRKNNLKYFVMGGSLIGVIRHKGYIPWDDDIDVAMLRADYEKLMEIGKDEFKPPYFLQNPDTDEGYYFSYAKLRNSNTSAISYPFRYEKFNQGIPMDIFPLDKCVMEGLEKRFNKINDLIMENSANMRRSNPNPTLEEKARIEKYAYRNPREVYNEMLAIATQYNNIDTDIVNTAVLTAYSYDKLVYKKSWFDEIVYREYEGIPVAIPQMYDEVLRIQYGDYMQLPPVESRGQWHNTAIFNPDIPYKEFIKTIN